MGFETYTGQFRLGRIERSVKLLKEITELAPAVKTSQDEVISNTYKAIRDDLESYVNHRFSPFDIPSWALKAFAAAVPWVFLSLIMLLSGTEGMRAAMGGILFCSIPLIVIAALIPDSQPSWVKYAAYPIGSSLLMILVVALYSKWQKKANLRTN